jgi:hypothetical protein
MARIRLEVAIIYLMGVLTGAGMTIAYQRGARAARKRQLAGVTLPGWEKD